MEKESLQSDATRKAVPGIPGIQQFTLYERTCELARIAGRSPGQIRQRDYEEAKREWARAAEMDRNNGDLDSPFAAARNPWPTTGNAAMPSP